MTSIHDIRALMSQGQATVGSWLQLPSADAAELLARAGYDWVAVDMEQGSFGRSGLPEIFRAIACGGAAAFARTPEAATPHYQSAMLAGPPSPMLPQIQPH